MTAPKITLKDIFSEAQKLIDIATEKKITIATAESCTGVLDVPPGMIAKYGAVSREVARAMAQGAVETLNVDMAVSVTGVAGPGGGSEEKPVGTVWMGLAVKVDGNIEVETKLHSFGNIGRNKVRDVTCYEALRAFRAGSQEY